MKSRLIIYPRDGTGHWVMLVSFRFMIYCANIWQHCGIMVSSFFVLLFQTMWPPFKKCLWSRMSLWGCKPLFIYRARGLSFLSIVAFRYFVEVAEDLSDNGHFLSWKHRTPGRAPWQALGIPEPASHLFPWSLLKMTWLQIFSLMLELRRVEVWSLASPKVLPWMWVLVSQAMKRVYEQTVQMLCLYRLCQRNWGYSATRFSISRRLIYFRWFNFFARYFVVFDNWP